MRDGIAYFYLILLITCAFVGVVMLVTVLPGFIYSIASTGVYIKDDNDGMKIDSIASQFCKIIIYNTIMGVCLYNDKNVMIWRYIVSVVKHGDNKPQPFEFIRDVINGRLDTDGHSEDKEAVGHHLSLVCKELKQGLKDVGVVKDVYISTRTFYTWAHEAISTF